MFDHSEIEEANCKCFQCSSGLSYVESSLFGNRCVFCSNSNATVGLVEWMKRAYYDYRIFKINVSKRGDDWSDMYLGALGVCGHQDINQCKTSRQKKALIKELKKLI